MHNRVEDRLSMISHTKRLAAVAATALLVVAATNPAHATEGGVSVYLNGFSGFMAGVVPPPGTYATNYVYHYSGVADSDLELRSVGVNRPGPRPRAEN
jgi:hypothetical protein